MQYKSIINTKIERNRLPAIPCSPRVLKHIPRRIPAGYAIALDVVWRWNILREADRLERFSCRRRKTQAVREP
jgi:hypothetical protein